MSSPLRQLAALAGFTLAGLLVLGVRADIVEAGAGTQSRPFYVAVRDTTDSLRADSLRRDSLRLDSLRQASLQLDPASADSLAEAVIRAAGLLANKPVDPPVISGDSLAGVAAALDSLASDSVFVALSDSSFVPPDTTDSTRLAQIYLRSPMRTGTSVSLMQRRQHGLIGRLGPYWQRSVTLDSTAYRYTIREMVGMTDVRAPAQLDRDDYLVVQRREALANGFRTMSAQRTNAGRRRGGVGLTVDIPGGDESAFRTLFGKNEVDLTVSGSSNVDMGLSYNQNDLQTALTGRGGNYAPDFGQQLNLNVAGTIGDKLRINVNYDTQSQFEFENQVSLVYSGYADDIIQRIEAGNVFLQTPSELIRGGQRLFGLRTDLQFGPLAVTAVASQQDAETNEVLIEGGSQSTPYQIAPYAYDDDTHFFLGYAFHNWWDSGHAQPGVRTIPPGMQEIVNIEVWKHDPGLITTVVTNTDETTYAVALADLAEPPSVLLGGEEYLASFSDPGLTPLPDSTLDRYTQADIEQIRTEGSAFDPVTAFGLPTGSAANNIFRRLRREIDYTIDPALGYISLTTPLGTDDVLAVTYEYTTTDGRRVAVGDYGRTTQDNSQNGGRTVMKLLRAPSPTQTAPLWDLTMRNIYRVGGRSLNSQAFTLGLTYNAPGSTASEILQDVTFGDQLTLLQVLGLDRVNEQGTPTPDNVFDFQPGLTVDPSSGRIIFPVRQPFGDYMTRLLTTGRTISGDVINVSFAESLEDALSKYSFEQLYDLKPQQVSRQFPQLSRYSVAGEFKSATQSVFNIGFNLVEGTVRVTSGGQQLVENRDFRVNTSAGTLEITNAVYLQTGAQVRVQAEQNKLFSIGSKTLLGLRANYEIDEDASLGATWMRLSEQPLRDKFQIGEEALDNVIFGLDGRYQAEPRWLTRALDALPLIQTATPSRFEVRAEYAQLLPGHPETLAFRRSASRLSRDGFEFPVDERSGVSYIDDFEGSENAYTALGEPNGWRIAALPAGAGPANPTPPSGNMDVTDPLLATNWRGLMAWYSISETLYRGAFQNITNTRATIPVSAADLFPERQFVEARDRTRPLSLLDIYFDPTQRGPYNYNGQLQTALTADPRTVWGGMVRPIDGNYKDFEGQNNIEFIEMLISPLGGRNGDEPIAEGAKLVLDLGRMNEDILPNGVLNSEDGIRDGGVPTGNEIDSWGRRPTGQTNGVVGFIEETGRTEDLGLDGLPSNVNDSANLPYEYDERAQFADFLATLTPGSPEAARAARDPSGDDYHHFLEEASWFGDAALYPGGATAQERFSNYLPSFELNTVIAQSNIARSGQQGISTFPNSEDINGNSTIDFAQVYHRYELPLDAAGLESSPFVQNTIQTEGQTWYLVRIPVRTTNRVTSDGLDPDDFSLIETARLWTTGHDRPATIRMATFKLVGSQWLKSDQVGSLTDPTGTDPVPDTPDPRLFIETINSEESPTTYAIPRGAIRNTARSSTGGGIVETKDQALVFRAEELADTRSAGIVRSYSTRPQDLTKYSNLRAFVHGHGFNRRDSVRVFVRLGDDETENYYEYEQPVYPFDPDLAPALAEGPRADSLWQANVPVGGENLDLNSINIVLSELNKLKVARDRAIAVGTVSSFEEVFRSTTTPTGGPPGARLAVRGQPSIDDIRTVVFGVRNREGGDTVPLDTVEVWINELRVSGYDEASGSSGFLNANLTLADLGSVQARMSFTQDGFGDLGGGLGDRDFVDRAAFTLTSSFNAHKLLPERFGLNVPVNLTVSQNQATPRYDPNRGDIRLSELVDAALEDSLSSDADRQLNADRLVERAQSVSSARNFRISASKNGSRSPWLRYTLDGITGAYSNNAQTARSPANERNDAESWTANLAYRLTVPRPKTVRPLWFTSEVPVIGAIGGLRLNVLPQSVLLSTVARRSVSNTRPRLQAIYENDPVEVQQFRVRTRRTQLFDHDRQLDVQYNPFSFLTMAYGSNTRQDLGAAGQVENFSILVRRPETDSTAAFSQVYGISPEEASAPGSVVRQDLGLADNASFNQVGVEVLGGSTLDIVPFGSVISRLMNGTSDIRTRGYTQTVSSALRLSTRKVKWLSWIRPQPLSYTTNYQWDDVPIATAPDLRVASAGTRVQLQTGLQLAPRDFWRLFPFYRNMEAAAGGRRQQAAQTDSTRRGFRPATIARTAFLAVTGITDLTLTYRGAFSSTTGGILGDSYSLFSALRGNGPPIGYRLGIDRSLSLDNRLGDTRTSFQYSDLLSDQHTLEARTQLEPFRSLRIGLIWQASFQQAERQPFGYRASNTDSTQIEPVRLPNDQRGGGSASVFAFGSSYNSFLARHRARLDGDLAGTPEASGAFASEFLLRGGLASDFRNEFARGLGSFGPGALIPIPVPGWDVTYTGLSSLPLIKRATNQVQMRHNYSASTQSDYTSFFGTADRSARNIQVGAGADPLSYLLLAPLTANNAAALEPTTVSVNERYQPMLGMNVSWKAGFQTDLTWNRSNLYSLQATSASLTEKKIQDLQLQFSFSKSGMKIPGLKRLNNMIRVTLNASTATDETFNHSIVPDLNALLRQADPPALDPQRTRRISFWPRVSYTVSNQVTADFFVRYERSTPAPPAFPTKTVDGGVSLRILFSN